MKFQVQLTEWPASNWQILEIYQHPVYLWNQSASIKITDLRYVCFSTMWFQLFHDGGLSMIGIYWFLYGRDKLVPTGFYIFWFLYDRDLRHERANIDLYNINSVKTKLLVLLWNKRAKMTWSTICGYCAEAVVWICSVEKVFLEILQNSQENTCARVSFLIKLQALKKRNF